MVFFRVSWLVAGFQCSVNYKGLHGTANEKKQTDQELKGAIRQAQKRIHALVLLCGTLWFWRLCRSSRLKVVTSFCGKFLHFRSVGDVVTN